MTKAQQRKQDKALPGLAEPVMALYGAVKGETHWTGTVDYTLQISAGEVFISVLQGWIHIRLPEGLKRVSSPFVDRPNPFSGKWNIHGYTNTDMLEELHRRLGWLSELEPSLVP